MTDLDVYRKELKAFSKQCIIGIYVKDVWGLEMKELSREQYNNLWLWHYKNAMIHELVQKRRKQ